MLFCSHTLKADEKQNERNWAQCNSELPKGRERGGRGGGGGGGERERESFVACLVAVVSERFFMHTVSVAGPNILVLRVSLCVRIGSSFFLFFSFSFFFFFVCWLCFGFICF